MHGWIHTCFETALAARREPALPAYQARIAVPWFGGSRASSGVEPPEAAELHSRDAPTAQPGDSDPRL
jgi:hypothetical protein